MWMGRASSPSSRSERNATKLWSASAIPERGCRRSRRTRSLVPYLRRSLMAPAWDCPSAAPSLNHIAVASGLPTTLCAAQVFTSFYRPKSRHMSLWVLPRPKCIRGERGLVEITHLVDFTLPFGSGEASGAPPPPGRRLILNEVISDAVDNPEFWQARWSVAADRRGSVFREPQGLPRLPRLEFAIYCEALAHTDPP